MSEMEYWKITNPEENHHGVHYKDGLVTLLPDETFNTNPNEQCSRGGLYFTHIENVNKFIEFGPNVRSVTLPSDAKVVHIYDKSRADKLILGEKENLFSPENIVKFKLYKNKDLVNHLSYYNQVDALEWLKNFEYEFKYTIYAINWASGKGYIDILEWWKNSGFNLKYTEFAIDYASYNGYVDVLEWWKNSGLEFKYTEYAIDCASQKGHIHVLEWWKKSGYTLKYRKIAIKWAVQKGHVNVLEWWKNSGLIQ